MIKYLPLAEGVGMKQQRKTLGNLFNIRTTITICISFIVLMFNSCVKINFLFFLSHVTKYLS